MKARLVLKEKVNNNSTSIFDFIVKGKKVGFLQLREKPSAGVGVPKNLASHIYYEINEEERGKGYGTKLLGLGLQKAKKIGLEDVSVSVMGNNVPSKKIIEKNGGVFIEQATSPGGMMLRYQFNLTSENP